MNAQLFLFDPDPYMRRRTRSRMAVVWRDRKRAVAKPWQLCLFKWVLGFFEECIAPLRHTRPTRRFIFWEIYTIHTLMFTHTDEEIAPMLEDRTARAVMRYRHSRGWYKYGETGYVRRLQGSLFPETTCSAAHANAQAIAA